MDKVHYQSDCSNWETPQELFDSLNNVFTFDVDVCANASNRKLGYYFSEELDGLKQDWTQFRCWCNPPYGKGIGLWTSKALETFKQGGFVVMLLPSRTDTKWWHDTVKVPGVEVIHLKGRIKFVGAKSCAPFPSAIAIYDGPKHQLIRRLGYAS